MIESEMDITRYQTIESYAKSHQLTNTLKALPIVREKMLEAKKEESAAIHYGHCLGIAQMIIDLHMPLQDEEDYTITAALCHVLPEVLTYDHFYQTMTEEYQLDNQVCEILQIINRHANKEDMDAYYDTIKKNKMALIVKLGDRSNLVSFLHKFSLWDAKQYINETRTEFLPLCIYGKEHYPEYLSAFNIIMEKMRTHIDASEALIFRFEAQENDLQKQILELQEENARIRGILERLKQQ